ncbi:hypothetical protein SAMN05444001_11937 [Parabacteroides chinchillae]|uniref:Uncharacterized protein n=1 Tax=Parabacteroides chinchillae TaxID=871327 RepID=A0A8G2BYG5_9BACT|nr:hypothetical protein SAMN05444001_11937 [Parabacteroides chinchillae]
MRRIASHYIYCHQVYKMHYLELTDEGLYMGLYPLTEEIAGTEFYDGILVPVSSQEKQIYSDLISIPFGRNSNFSRKEFIFSYLDLIKVSLQVEKERPVRLVLLNGSPLTATELCTNNSGSDCYI